MVESFFSFVSSLQDSNFDLPDHGHGWSDFEWAILKLFECAHLLEED
jgi:hypothetical protein